MVCIYIESDRLLVAVIVAQASLSVDDIEMVEENVPVHPHIVDGIPLSV